MSPETLLLVLGLIDHLALAMQLTGTVRADYELFSAKLRAMVAEDRDPTEDEWQELNARIDAARAKLLANDLRAAADAMEPT